MTAPFSMPSVLAFAHALADASGAIIKNHMHGFKDFETKDDASPVTAIDKLVEQTLRSQIQATYPEHGILGEEFDGKDLGADYVWVIDPIDGTKSFITGVPVYGTLICLAHKGRPVLGIIDHPATNDRWVGAQGMPSIFNGETITTRLCPSLGDALLSCSNPEPFRPLEREAFETLRDATKWRIYGSSCYAYGCVASGTVDIAIDCGRHREVDYCALVPVIEGAGGMITDWEGEPLTIYSGNRLVASGNPELHKEVLAILARAER
ncbi:MAG: histidinol-phosphatase [Candidimonas sp.]|jgi:inositol-phosphate phosphatase/L-galactose 1-phosphate phosphatase/histidinol-phosphatase